MFQQVLVEAVSIEDILILDGDIDHTPGNLVLRYLQTQNLLVRERQLVDHDDVTVRLLEALGTVERIDWRKLNGL